MSPEFEAQLQAAIALELPHEFRPRPGTPLLKDGRQAAVLILFADSPEGPSLLLTRRSDTIETHKGQMAFPGGTCDPEDECSLATTALRETEEEVGIPRALVRVLGTLPELATITGFRVAPVVGVLTVSASEVELRANPEEIAEAFWTPISVLLTPENFRVEQYPVGAVTYPIHVFQVGKYRVWGATGTMLKNLVDRLRLVD